jgi:hypothetical protein
LFIDLFLFVAEIAHIPLPPPLLDWLLLAHTAARNVQLSFFSPLLHFALDKGRIMLRSNETDSRSFLEEIGQVFFSGF